MKDNSLQKKISKYDRLQALLRKPSYRADHWDFTFWCRERGINEWEYLNHPEATEKAQEIFRKYGITRLIHPADKDLPENWLEGDFIDEEKIVEVIYPTEYRDLTDDEIKRGVRHCFMPIPVFKNGEDLIIKINLKADKGIIVKKFIEKLNYYKYFIPRNKSRKTPDRMLNKWVVFDTYNKMKSFEKTAQNIKGRAGSRSKLNVSTIRKAYYRAFELVYGEKFDPHKHKPEKLPVKLRRTCNKCPEYSTCEALCPEAWEYYTEGEKYQRETLMTEQELDIISSPRSHRKAPKPQAD